MHSATYTEDKLSYEASHRIAFIKLWVKVKTEMTGDIMFEMSKAVNKYAFSSASGNLFSCVQCSICSIFCVQLNWSRFM